MGIESSKSPLERRNTVARRSQRRSIHNIKAKVDKLFQDIKKFKGTEENDTYKSILSELEHTRDDLRRKAKDLQPQIRGVYDTTLKRIDEAVQALSDKLIDNQDKSRKKQEELEGKERKRQEEQEEKARQKEEKEAKSKKKKKKKGEIDDDDDEVESVDQNYEETNYEKNEIEEANNLSANTEKRQTVELKFVQITTPEQTRQEDNNVAKKLVSPEEKRKSILKVGGVAVMPGAMLNELSAATKSKHSVHYHQSIENLNDDPGARLNEIIENLQAIECQIADFVGRKHGTQYNRIRDKLNGYLAEITTFFTTDEFLLEQIKLCKNYVSSCMTFLDEKAIDDRKYDSRDDVFLPSVDEHRSVSMISPTEVEEKLNRLTKTTAI